MYVSLLGFCAPCIRTFLNSLTEIEFFNNLGMDQMYRNGLKPGDRIELKIDGVAFGGDGVGRFREQVVFVPFTVDGDEAAIRVTEVKKRFIRGRLEQLLAPSPWRIEPRCRYYTRCGGCQYQHIRDAHQAKIKEQQVNDAFVRIGRITVPPVSPIVTAPPTFQYRCKADYHVRTSAKEPPLIGFMDVENRRLVDIDHCEIVDESINEACLAFRRDLATGRLKTPWNRQTIWSADAIGEKAEVVTDFRRPRFVMRTVKGQNLMAPYRGFFQANDFLLPRLVDDIVETSDLSGRESVADVHCGSGLFSLFLAPRVQQLYGIEMDGEAIHCARLNHRQAGFTHALFYRGDAGDVLQRVFVAGKKKIDVLILDPPRIGCDPALISAVTVLKPMKLIYLSCNPATQARDIGLMIEQGFALKSLRPFDMFPQTAHIEAVALLERPG